MKADVHPNLAELYRLKVAGYVGCQTVRPFADTDRGGKYDTYDDPEFLDNFTEATGARAVPFDAKTSCCGGAVALISPEKTLGIIKTILEAAKQADADVIAARRRPKARARSRRY